MKKKYMVTLTDEEQQLDRHLATNRPLNPALALGARISGAALRTVI